VVRGELLRWLLALLRHQLLCAVSLSSLPSVVQYVCLRARVSARSVMSSGKGVGVTRRGWLRFVECFTL
jgi:hypothetical protein